MQEGDGKSETDEGDVLAAGNVPAQRGAGRERGGGRASEWLMERGALGAERGGAGSRSREAF